MLGTTYAVGNLLGATVVYQVVLPGDHFAGPKKLIINNRH